MKFFVMTFSLAAALVFSLTSGFVKAWSLPKKIVLMLSIAISLCLTILPPIGAVPEYVYEVAENGIHKPLNIILDFKAANVKRDDTLNAFVYSMPDNQANKLIISGNNLPEELKSDNQLILKVVPKNQTTVEYISTVSINPPIYFAFVWALQERIKILSLHVPIAWASALAYFISVIFSIRYLKKKDLIEDIKASSSAMVGTVCAILTTVTGMVWAKFNWGSFWNWDPRETSILILLMVYLAYFVLRSSLDNVEIKARLSAVYAIIAGVAAPFLMFILPRLTAGLHPGSADDSSSGPVLSSQPGMLDSSLLYSFGLGLFAFTVLFFFLMNMSVRYQIVNQKSNMLK